jgi:ribose transport system permease protein
MSRNNVIPRSASASGLNLVKRLSRMRGLLIAIGVFAVLVTTISNIGAVRLSYYDVSQMSSSGATLALVAIGGTLVVLSGGLICQQVP